MSTTLTIRTDEGMRRDLEEIARARKETVSQVAREILRSALTQRPFAERTGHLRGQLALGPQEVESQKSDPWRREIAERNRRS